MTLHSAYSLVVYTSKNNSFLIPDNLFNIDLEVVEVDNKENYRKSILLRALTATLFDDPMPGWVYVDCAILPSAYITIVGPSSHATSEQLSTMNIMINKIKDDLVVHGQYDNLCRRLGKNVVKEAFADIGEDEIIPIAEYVADLSIDKNYIVGYSLGSLTQGYGRFVKSCAYSFYKKIYKVEKQIGMSQYFHPAVATHTRFGPLKILDPLSFNHTLGGETFVYECDIPSEFDLAILRSNDYEHDLDELARRVNSAEVVIINKSDESALDEMIAKQMSGERQYWIIDSARDGSSFTASWR